MGSALVFFTQSDYGNRADIQIWRRGGANATVRNTWGDYDEDVAEPPVPVLYGRVHADTLYDSVYEPRTTRVETRPEYSEQVTTTAITLFTGVDVDVRPGDFLAFTDPAGNYQVFKVEGEGMTNTYVSPFTGISGGREVFAVRQREAE